MKIIHTSDWHFGMALKAGVSMAEDQRFFLKQLYEIIENENIGAVIVSGDIYDSGNVGAEAIELYNEAVTRLCLGLRTPVIMIAGNHDSAARLSVCSELLKGAGLYIKGRLTRCIEPVLLDGGKTAVYPIPFFDRDEVRALFPEKSEEIKSLEDAYRVVFDGIRDSLDETRFNIAAAHAFIVDAELSESDRAARVGYAQAVPGSVFEGLDYTALGHIHKPQAVSENVRYSGSPVKFSFGAEEKQQKSLLIIDTETGKISERTLNCLHDRLTLTGTKEELIAAAEEHTEDYVRLNVIDRTAGLELLSELRIHYPNLLELYGRSYEAAEGVSVMTVDEIEKLDDTDICLRFLQELHPDYVPDERQIEIFRKAAEQSLEED